MENFSQEIVDLIMTDWKADESLVIKSLLYLYHTTTDYDMKDMIENVFNDMGYCVNCGSKLMNYEWEEVHTELPYNNIETMNIQLCPICNEDEINLNTMEEVR